MATLNSIRWTAAAGVAAVAGIATLAHAGGGKHATARNMVAFNQANASSGIDWPGYGGTSDEDHFSPLADINDGNVSRLGLAWWYDLPAAPSTVGAPVAIGGKVYVGVGLSVTRAFDGPTGKLLWTYDPQVARVAGNKLQMAWGIRGIGYGFGKVYTGTQDGRLLAINAATGKLAWSVQTTEGAADGRYITGAPRVFRDMVIIGHGGSDTGNVRGYVTAYDAHNGKQRWRFYTVPGEPTRGFENEAMATAAKTWSGEWWKLGGGGAVWNAITYDAELDRIYLGTGNGAPWNQNIRSPAGGDNLFLSSIVALDARSGRYIWHYQTTPGETWDFNSATDISLATLTIDGHPRRVILHAPKNGFFYVIDRDTGRLISGKPFAKTTWASEIDPTTGRPIELPGGRPGTTAALVYPGSTGAHTWHAQSFSPLTGLVYLPMQDVPALYDPVGIDTKSWVRKPGLDGGYQPITVVGKPTPLPDKGIAALIAWDPIAQRQRWAIPLAGVQNGGVLSTAGNLVFEGQAAGQFAAYNAASGKLLWSYFAQNGIIGQPITFKARGRQFITVVTGLGGGAGATPNSFPWSYRDQKRRVLTFTLNGKAKLPRLPAPQPAVLADDPAFKTDPALVAAGDAVYGRRCLVCHGVGAIAGGTAPDLRQSPVPLDRESFALVVQQGLLLDQGMPKFVDVPDQELEALRHYIRAQQRATAVR